MTYTLQELKDLIIHKLDAVELLDLLALDVSDLVELLEDQIIENREEVTEAVR